ncbi:hypothetical protein FVE85_9527 [Porphyridium purpureum]|uniref:Uncharacterized protein n=1 Tax=Porphyridium purpureum TaxID=35688 RepID=A0A5J4YJK1_PORPP|nr:hypothetical protein FVE85_9527 [Porphyridium purpureum]|eukprot:POR5999..scf261_15
MVRVSSSAETLSRGREEEKTLDSDAHKWWAIRMAAREFDARAVARKVVAYPVYVSVWVRELALLVVCGGGGELKTGIPNCVDVFALERVTVNGDARSSETISTADAAARRATKENRAHDLAKTAPASERDEASSMRSDVLQDAPAVAVDSQKRTGRATAVDAFEMFLKCRVELDDMPVTMHYLNHSRDAPNSVTLVVAGREFCVVYSLDRGGVLTKASAPWSSADDFGARLREEKCACVRLVALAQTPARTSKKDDVSTSGSLVSSISETAVVGVATRSRVKEMKLAEAARTPTESEPDSHAQAETEGQVLLATRSGMIHLINGLSGKAERSLAVVDSGKPVIQMDMSMDKHRFVCCIVQGIRGAASFTCIVMDLDRPDYKLEILPAARAASGSNVKANMAVRCCRFHPVRADVLILGEASPKMGSYLSVWRYARDTGSFELLCYQKVLSNPVTAVELNGNGSLIFVGSAEGTVAVLSLHFSSLETGEKVAPISQKSMNRKIPAKLRAELVPAWSTEQPPSLFAGRKRRTTLHQLPVSTGCFVLDDTHLLTGSPDSVLMLLDLGMRVAQDFDVQTIVLISVFLLVLAILLGLLH